MTDLVLDLVTDVCPPGESKFILLWVDPIVAEVRIFREN